jgi:hypothetical protein
LYTTINRIIRKYQKIDKYSVASLEAFVIWNCSSQLSSQSYWLGYNAGTKSQAQTGCFISLTCLQLVKLNTCKCHIFSWYPSFRLWWFHIVATSSRGNKFRLHIPSNANGNTSIRFILAKLTCIGIVRVETQMLINQSINPFGLRYLQRFLYCFLSFRRTENIYYSTTKMDVLSFSE